MDYLYRPTKEQPIDFRPRTLTIVRVELIAYSSLLDTI